MGLTPVSHRRRRQKSGFVRVVSSASVVSSREDEEVVSPRRTRSGKVLDYIVPSAAAKKNTNMIIAPKPDFGHIHHLEEDSRLSPLLGGSSSNFSTPKASPRKKAPSAFEAMEEDEDDESSLILPSLPSLLLPSATAEEERLEGPPPKIPFRRKSAASRFRTSAAAPRAPHFDLDDDEEEEEGNSSPPTRGVMSLNLFDSPATTKILSPAFASRKLALGALKPNVLFSHGKQHRSDRRSLLSADSKTARANLNPFTPEGLMVSHQKRARLRMELASPGGSFSELQKSLDQMSDVSDDNDSSLSDFQPPLAKRIRVSDIHISRYNKEFVELQSLASGEYGCVKVARHRLDGMVYAIKVTKKVIQPCSHAEHMAMNEVFAHAAIMKHKHVIRYFNSWVENCQVYIQTEYCEGGSLQSQINTYRKRNRRFPESELRTILTQIAKGLHYIHSKDLVHMDIKPENIFIAIEHPSSPSTSPGGSIIADAPARNSGNESTDSGNHSGNDAVNTLRNNLRGTERLTYKIGDLGNIAQIHGDFIPEEGDCRFMAPELFAIHVDRSKLPKADVFSLGLSVYATASLKDIPKNSMDDPVMYDRIKRGEIPYLDCYSKEFNQVLRSMVSPDPSARPSPSKIMNIFQNNSNYAVKSRSQLCKELKDSEARIRQLEELLSQAASGSVVGTPAAVNASPHNSSCNNNINNSFSIMDNSISSSISSVSNPAISSPAPLSNRSKVTSTPNILANKAVASNRSVGKGAMKSASCIL